LASVVEEASFAEPVRRRPAPGPKPKPKPATRAAARRRARARSGVLWIAVAGVLLAGVVFVNVAVLRLNLQLDRMNQQRTKLRAENAALQSERSSRLASPRITELARRQDGLVPADPATIGYVNLGR
jgi:cell division protein FtsL